MLNPANAAEPPETPFYRVTPLKNLNFIPDADHDGTMGINLFGEVVYGFKETTSSDMRAWVFLPVSRYGMSAGVHTISVSGDEPAIARDINNSGLVVGQADGIGTSGGLATLWTLGSTIDVDQFGTFDGSPAWSSAHAINDGSPAVVVGDSNARRSCLCPAEESLGDPIPRAFKVNANGSTLTELLPEGDNSASFARDINTAATVRIGGYSDCLGLLCTLDQCARVTKNPTYWQSTSGTVMSEGNETAVYVLGINASAEMVGVGFELDGSICRRRAMYWSSPSATPSLLPMPSGDSSDKRQAHAISSGGKIVGYNPDDDEALLWYKVSGSYIVEDVNRSGFITCQTRWIIKQGHDINSNSEIATHGERQTTAGPYTAGQEFALLLTPMNECPEDVNKDGTVNGTDYNLVVNGYGECPIGEFCWNDVNGDCVVDATDAAQVLASYGDCEQGSGPMP